MSYFLIGILVFGVGMFVYAMFKDGKHGRRTKRPKNRAELNAGPVRENVYRLDFSTPLDDGWIWIFLSLCMIYFIALDDSMDAHATVLSRLVEDPRLIAAGIMAGIGLILIRINFRSWYEYDLHTKVLCSRIRIRWPDWTGTWSEYRGVRHIAIRPPRIITVGYRREFRPVMVLESGKEVRIGDPFRPLWYDESVLEYRRLAETLNLDLVEPPPSKQPRSSEKKG